MPKNTQKSQTAAEPEVKRSEPNKQKPKKGKAQTAEREVVYPTLKAVIAATGHAGPITRKHAEDLLGWEVIGEGAGRDAVPMLTDIEGNKIRCLNNTMNRPYDINDALRYGQEVLNRRFAPKGPNGETIIISRTGEVLSGQRRLTGLVLACQIWAGKDKGHWLQLWPTEPVIESFIVFGVDDSQETIRTIDNVRTRTLADTLYTSGLFGKVTAGDLKAMSRIADYACRLLWHRTGADKDAFSPKMTHSEALEFIGRHPRILRAVKHIWEEDKKGLIRYYLTPGYAAALLFMMGCSASGEDEEERNGRGQIIDYADAEPAPHEGVLDWSRWDPAIDFWVQLASKSDSTKAVRMSRRPIPGDVKDRTGYVFAESEGGNVHDRMAVLCKAWRLFVAGEKLTEVAIRCDYEVTRLDDGSVGSAALVETPTVGGIDLGNPKDGEEKDEADGNGHVEYTEEKVNGRKPNKGAGAVDKETPEQERARREKVDAEAAAERERKKKELLDNRRKRAGGKGEEANGAPPKPRAKDEVKGPTPKGDGDKTLADELKELHDQHPGFLIVFRSQIGFSMWGLDAKDAAKILGLKTTLRQGDVTDRLQFKEEDDLRKLLDAGKRVAIVEQRGKERVVNEVALAPDTEEPAAQPDAGSVEEPTPKIPPKPKAKGKPKAAAK
jgi:hypothetical protein